MSTLLGIDIGGTAVKIGVVDENGKVLLSETRSVSFDGYKTSIMTTVANLAGEVLEKSPVKIEGIGVSATGQIDVNSGTVIGVGAQLGDWLGSPVKKILEEEMANAVQLSVPMLAEVTDPKVAYTFHSYEPLIFTHQGAYWVKGMPSDFRISYPNTIENYREASKMLSQELAGAIFESELPEMGPDFFETLFRPALDIAEERDIPLYCGEYGVIDLADNDSKIRWATDICAVFDKYGIGRAYWNYKEKDYGIVDIPDESVQRELAAKL